MTTHLVKQNLNAKISQSTAGFRNPTIPLELSSCQKIREREEEKHTYIGGPVFPTFIKIFSLQTYFRFMKLCSY